MSAWLCLELQRKFCTMVTSASWRSEWGRLSARSGARARAALTHHHCALLTWWLMNSSTDFVENLQNIPHFSLFAAQSEKFSCSAGFMASGTPQAIVNTDVVPLCVSEMNVVSIVHKMTTEVKEGNQRRMHSARNIGSTHATHTVQYTVAHLKALTGVNVSWKCKKCLLDVFISRGCLPKSFVTHPRLWQGTKGARVYSGLQIRSKIWARPRSPLPIPILDPRELAIRPGSECSTSHQWRIPPRSVFHHSQRTRLHWARCAFLTDKPTSPYGLSVLWLSAPWVNIDQLPPRAWELLFLGKQRHMLWDLQQNKYFPQK